MNPKERRVVRCIQNALSPDLLKPKYRRQVAAGAHPHTGHCYVAAEAAQALLGKRYRPEYVRHEGEVHWYLRGPRGAVVDPTASQFKTPVPYHKGRGCGWSKPTPGPSKRAITLLRRLNCK